MVKLESSLEEDEKASEKITYLMASFEENEMELEDLRKGKGRMLHKISTLENELHGLHIIEEKCSGLEESQKEAEQAWARVDELEETLKMLQDTLAEVDKQAGKAPRIEALEAELESVKATLAERDEQLAESRKGIAEAQKMIFRLMNTVQDLRKKAREQGSDKYALSE